MLPQMIQRRGAVHLAEQDPAFDLFAVPRAVIELVPESVARENLVLPVRFDGETLICAAADPTNLHVRDKLSFILNKNIRLVPAPPAAVLAAINRHYGQTRTESVDSMLADFTDTAIEFTQVEPPSGVLRTRAAKPRSLGKAVIDFKKGINELEESTDFTLSRAAFAQPGEDATPSYGSDGMWFYVVEEGQRVLVTRPDGRMEVIVGPKRVWRGWSRFERMRHFVAHPGEFLVVRFRDGRQEHLTGPADLWFDPRTHAEVTRQEALQLAAKEAVIVYSRSGDAVTRRIVYGPTLFVPAPGEWLHTFTWHGSDGGSVGTRKVAKGLVFQKLWLLPDQMYHDVPDVRTADDAVLTIRLMIFFELADIERMLDTTHDPIGDFVNAATSDVVDFTGRRTFDQFKQQTGDLNELGTYRQLSARAAQTGYRITKVVYRGYGAPDRLQAMHDQAIEARTRLQLERATEQQAQDLEDYRLTAQLTRAARRRTEQTTEVEAELELNRKRQEAELARTRRAADLQEEVRRQADQRQRDHLAALREMGVDLTAYLTQGRADRVIEFRGGNGPPHVHLDRLDGAGGGGKTSG